MLFICQDIASVNTWSVALVFGVKWQLLVVRLHAEKSRFAVARQYRHLHEHRTGGCRCVYTARMSWVGSTVKVGHS